ncbi:MAG TPA: hypothetical protein VGF17_17360, partial [Phytomonospora sp.]
TEPTAVPRAPRNEMQAAARVLFDQAIADDPLTKPDAKAIHDAIGSTANPATTRRWIQQWYSEHEATLDVGRPELGPVAPPLQVVERASTGTDD